ncbi:MAG: dTMP kinase [Planctomycetaceae bacterium]|nr:dTMP kinase [Planctomycetaceae bacterium]
MLIAIEGIDGSGKGTQAARLRDRLEASGRSVTLLSFPRYDATRFGKVIGDFLNGRFGALNEVHPLLASLLYAGDRFESRQMLEEAIRSQDVVVLDRYVASNIAHQGAKLQGEERAELISWVETVEHEIYGLPKPDLTLLLDLPAATAQQLIAKKSARTYTEKKADLQEADGGYLASVREVYRELAVDQTHWQIVPCLREDSLKTIDEISDEVFAIVEASLRSS